MMEQDDLPIVGREEFNPFPEGPYMDERDDMPGRENFNPFPESPYLDPVDNMPGRENFNPFPEGPYMDERDAMQFRHPRRHGGPNSFRDRQQAPPQLTT